MAMLGSAKPLASLSSTLLARKGQARPAMRRQGFDHTPVGTSLEDLGWNDMGAHDMGEPEPVHEPMPEPLPETVPPVLIEREALAREVAVPVAEPETQAEPEPAAEFVEEAPPVSRRKACRIARESAEQTARGKAAFTLRLDPERHLRLRLASAVAGRSAQQLVAGALDDFFLSMPEVEALAAQLPVKKARP